MQTVKILQYLNLLSFCVLVVYYNYTTDFEPEIATLVSPTFIFSTLTVVIVVLVLFIVAQSSNLLQPHEVPRIVVNVSYWFVVFNVATVSWLVLLDAQRLVAAFCTTLISVLATTSIYWRLRHYVLGPQFYSYQLPFSVTTSFVFVLALFILSALVGSTTVFVISAASVVAIVTCVAVAKFNDYVFAATSCYSLIAMFVTHVLQHQVIAAYVILVALLLVIGTMIFKKFIY